MSKKLFIALIALVVSSLGVGVAYANFTDQTKFQSSTFTTASADLKLLVDLAGGTEPTNLIDTKAAPNYTGIYPLWTQDELIKLYNNGSQVFSLTSNCDYMTANDPANLRENLFVEFFAWTDANGNGGLDEGELGTSYGKKVFTSWKSTGFNLGTIQPGQTLGLVLRFSANSIPASKQGQTGVYDFIFDVVGQ